MASHKSAEKRARQTERRTAVNIARRSRVRSSIKKVEEAIKSGDKQSAMAALRAAQPEIQRGATKRVVAKNAAARRVSRLAARVKAMA
ncbi:MAG: 30S ribosomal protein S20 [Alphaproteobacteria bacterium]|nr:30S ribosomal protein S20 [Alphaproteobacteria bacterium]MBV8409773.1 30S ribosomal protein S20 [Alphaproteobacteria bacterium]